MTNTTLKESSIGLGKVSGKKRWTARLIATGRGSSGFYSETALRDTGALAFPAGTKINIDHASWEESMNFPAGSLKNLAGIVATTPEYREAGTDVDDLAGLYSEVEFSDEWAPFAEQFAAHIGLSINAQGYGEEYNDEGLRIVEGFIPSPLNTVDLVTAPGARGGLIQVLESYRETHGTLSTDANADEREDGMTPEEMKTAVKEAMAEAIPSFTAALTEAIKPAPKVEDENAVDAPSVSEITEALFESGLPKVLRTKVLESMSGGKSVEDAIAEQKTLLESLREDSATEENPGVVRESVKTTESITVSGWTR